jgi:DNA ligase-1
MTYLPMMCKSLTRDDLLKDWRGYLIEPKHDGMRAIAELDANGNLEITSRTGKTQLGKCLNLESLLHRLPPGTVIDGEIAYWNSVVDVLGQQVPIVNFNRTMRVMGSGPTEAVRKQKEFHTGGMGYVVFDCLQWADEDITNLTLAGRRVYLRRALDAIGFQFSIVLNPSYVPASGHLTESKYPTLTACEALERAGCEGIILKQEASSYQVGKRPNKTWYKIKKEQTFDVVVTGYTEGKGKYEDEIGAIEFGAYNPSSGKLVTVGKCSGMTDEERDDITEHQANYMGRVFVVKSNELVGSGKYRTPRHPNFQHWRDDKAAKDCSLEQFAVEED